MKKLLNIFITALIAILTTFVDDVNAQYILNDDFESYEVNTFPSDGGWSIRYNGAGNNQQFITNQYSNSGSKSFRLRGVQSWDARIINELESTPNVVYYQASFFSESISNEGWFALYNPTASTWGTAVSGVFFSGGKIYVGILEVPYDQSVWNTVKVKVDLVEQIISVWINDELLLENHEYSFPATPYTHFALTAINNGTNTVFFDDVRVWAANEEPAYRSFGPFAYTRDHFPHDSNWNQIISEIIGSDYRLADWNDFVNYYNDGNDLALALDELGIQYDMGGVVSRDGNRYWSGQRHYFIARHNGSPPGHFLVHAHISNYLLSLGSWWGNFRALAFKEDYQDSSDFIATVTVSDGLNNSVGLTIGTAPDATSGFDPQYDQLAPPPPPDGSFDARIVTDDEAYFTFIQPTTEAQTIWNLRFRPASGAAPITLSWDSDELDEEGSFMLVDVIDGSFVSVDMRAVSELVVPESFITDLRVIHSLEDIVERTYSSGWTLVGLPVKMNHESYSDIFNNATAGTLTGFNGFYTTENILKVGKGYWLRFDNEETVVFSGEKINSLELELIEQWNLIAGISESVEMFAINDPDAIIIPGTLFNYNAGWQLADILEPGTGYWIRANDVGGITITSTSTSDVPMLAGLKSETESLESQLGGFYKINIHSGKRDLIPLYFGGELPKEIHPLSFSMPPLPPSGAADARLDEDMRLTEAASVRVHLQQSGEPMTAEIISEAAVTQFIVRQLIGDMIIDEYISESSRTIDILAQTETLEIAPFEQELVEELPAEFALKQNYPNPFNPVTQIQYALPEAADVRLEVFNVTGQRVATLVNGSQNAGLHTVSFDASRLSSGVYIYRIQAGGFVQTKKMVLVR